MKTIALTFPLAIATALVATGCRSGGTYDKGPYLPQQSKTAPHENKEPVVLLDPGVQYSSTGLFRTIHLMHAPSDNAARRGPPQGPGLSSIPVGKTR